MVYEGFGRLRTVHDLYQKLTADYQRVLDHEGDEYCAFDFFVTAYHMIDWFYPNDRKGQEALENSEVTLKLCSHIANGAKHFSATAKKHQSARSVDSKKVLNLGSVKKNVVEMGYVSSRLYIALNGEAQEKYGPSIRVDVLAKEILGFWERTLYPRA